MRDESEDAGPARWRRLARQKIEQKAKPPGSLGTFEQLAEALCAAQESLAPASRPMGFYLFAADHGAALSGVSAWPQGVTRAVAQATLDGRSACAVFASAASVPVAVIDAGLAGEPLPGHARLVARRIRNGTRDLSLEPALTVDEFEAAIALGRDIAVSAASIGCRVVIAGEAGIGNTTASACLTALLCGLDAGAMVGLGAGATPEILAAKRRIAVEAVERARTRFPHDAMASVCGLEIAAMAGFYASAAQAGMTILLDGAVTAAAALIAERIIPGSRERMIASHLSSEPSHAAALAALGLQPFLDWNMRLGEGTGALLLAPMLDAAAAMMRDMADLRDVAG